MSTKKFLLASVLTLSSSLTVASELNYDYVELGYLTYDNAKGFNLELSKEFNENFYGRIDYSNLDVNNSSNDFSITKVNLGYKPAISSSTDFIAELGYEDITVGFLGINGGADGYNARLGIRSALSSNFELGAYGSYSDASEGSDFSLEARYHFNKNFSVALEAGNDSELNEHYAANFRYSF